MKIYFINKNGKNLFIRDRLIKMGFENIETMEKLKTRINKTDIVITTCFQEEYEEYQKVNHLIILTQETNPKKVYQMVSKLKVKDVIYFDKNMEYITERIRKAMT